MSFSGVSGSVDALEVSKGDQVAGNISAIRANNTLLSRLVARVAAEPQPRAAADEALRHIRDVRQQNRELASASHQLIREAEASAAAVKKDGKGGRAARRKSAANKLKKVQATKTDLTSATEEFSAVLALSVEQECKRAGLQPSPNHSPAAIDLEAQGDILMPLSEATPLLQSTAHTTEALHREEESNDAFLRDRAVALENIEASVRDVNGIFKDLAMMIGDQGTDLNQIEVNVAVAREKNQEAVRQVKRTRKRTMRCRQLFYWLLFVAVAFISLYIVVICA